MQCNSAYQHLSQVLVAPGSMRMAHDVANNRHATYSLQFIACSLSFCANELTAWTGIARQCMCCMDGAAAAAYAHHKYNSTHKVLHTHDRNTAGGQPQGLDFREQCACEPMQKGRMAWLPITRRDYVSMSAACSATQHRQAIKQLAVWSKKHCLHVCCSLS